MESNCVKFSAKEHFDWLRLIRSEGVGPNIFFRLLKMFSTAESALANLCQQDQDKQWVKIASEKQVQKELEQCQKIGARIIAYPEPEYPARLREIANPPPVITVLGNIELLSRDIIAIVGSRNASTNSCLLTQKIASELGKSDIIVASGMARGIDTAAHLGSIEYGTVAVVAGGIDIVYPRENTELYHQISKKGVIVSELPFGVPPRSSNFPQRNRIISGLSLGVLVAEATLNSGSLITAKYAIEQNREVFVIPGQPIDPRSQGCNKLIKEGAILIESANDIITEIYKSSSTNLFNNSVNDSVNTYEWNNVKKENKNELAQQILNKIGSTPVLLDDLIKSVGASVQAVNVVLTRLELIGAIRRDYGRVIRIMNK